MDAMHCAGTPVTFDCEGVARLGTAGTPCNDGDASTGNDTWNANCQCVGQVIDCLGVAGGTALPGTPATMATPHNDTWNACSAWVRCRLSGCGGWYGTAYILQRR
ncbi:MAG: hypothetical protein R2817_08935 [Flavobacteriales bacterium]